MSPATEQAVDPGDIAEAGYINGTNGAWKKRRQRPPGNPAIKRRLEKALASVPGAVSRRRFQARLDGAVSRRRLCRLCLPYNPASSASFDGVPAMRLISHSIADCGGIWLKPRRSVYTLSIWSGRNSFSSRRVPLVPMSIAG